MCKLFKQVSTERKLIVNGRVWNDIKRSHKVLEFVALDLCVGLRAAWIWFIVRVKYLHSLNYSSIPEYNVF